MAEQVSRIVAHHDHPDYGGRVAMFINVDAVQHTVRLYTDTVYNPVDAYHNCLTELVDYLEDAVFAWMYREEDDEGDMRYVINQYQIANNQLVYHRHYTAFGVDAPPALTQLLEMLR